MKTETKTLEALVQLALQRKTLLSVPSIQLIHAIHDLDAAFQTAQLTACDPQQLLADMQNALKVLSSLLYVINMHPPQVDAYSCKELLKQATALFKKISGFTKEYCNDPYGDFQPQPVKGLKKQVSCIDHSLQKKTATANLYGLLHPHMAALLSAKTISYHRWVWWLHFIEMFKNPPHDLTSFADILLRLNFNIPVFIRWMDDHLQQQLDDTSSTAEKLNLFSSLVIKYETAGCLTPGYIAGEASVQQVLLRLLKRKWHCYLKIPATDQFIRKPKPAKLHTALSVPQTALLVRLMVETGIIDEDNQSELMKKIASVISTSKADSISSESLRVNYYTPGVPAKNIVKEYLLSMIRLIANL